MSHNTSPKMLWFDNDKTRTLQEKIEQAVEYFTEKHGASPNVCYLHIDARAESEELKIDNLVLKTAKTVLKHHLWLGKEEIK